MPVYSFKLPDIGEGIAEAEIVAWHVAVGDMIEEDEPLADMMTDKATVEISAPVSGRVVEIAGQVGDQVAIGSILAVLDVAGAEEALPPSEPEAMPDTVVTLSRDVVVEVLEQAPPAPAAPRVEPLVEPRIAARQASASPAVRQRARALGIDLADVGTAGGDRVRHSDLDAFLSYNAAYRSSGGQREDEQVQVIGLRRRIAENMAAAKKNIPHFSYVEEIDVTKLEEMRGDLNAHRGERPKLTILPLLIVATCKAVVDFPMINARYDDVAGIVTRHGAVHMGIATQTDGGLMVPVIRDAQDRNIWQLASEISRLAEAARSGKARPAELSGSTLTITSLGTLGGIATTPVINRPEVAILGPNRIIERPVFRNGEIEAAKLMNMSISCDHRVVDGWDAASFVQWVKLLLESPALLFV